MMKCMLLLLLTITIKGLRRGARDTLISDTESHLDDFGGPRETGNYTCIPRAARVRRRRSAAARAPAPGTLVIVTLGTPDPR